MPTAPKSNFRGQATWDYIGDTYLGICQDKSICEVGPYDGWITHQILKNNPSSLTLIESSSAAVENLNRDPQISARCNIVHGDMHYDMCKVGKVDVAILLGIIYHSHAPLHFLEEMVNNCDPDTVLIDNPGNAFWYGHETPNEGGMRYVTSARKTCNIVITIDETIIVNAFTNMGYVLTKRDILPELSEVKEGNVPIYQFEKYDR